MSVEYAIVCDGCGRHIDASQRSAATARDSVRDMGGLTNMPGGKDLCNQCAEAPRAEAALKVTDQDGWLGNHQRWHVNRGKSNSACRYCAAGATGTPREDG